MLTNRVSNSIISDIHQYTQNYQIDKKKIELVCVNVNDEIDATKQSVSLSDLLSVKYVSEDKYSIGLYFKSWLVDSDHENEHVHILLPTNFQTNHGDPSSHVIRGDLQEILNNPLHHINHERFFIYTEPPRTATLTRSSPSLSLPIYQLKALNFIKQTNYCISMIFGMPLLVLPTSSRKYDRTSTEENEVAFDTLVEYLRQNELMLICRLNDSPSTTELFSGHFVLSCASERSLLLRSIASSEFLLPLPAAPNPTSKSEPKQTDQGLLNSLSTIVIDEEEYNPFYYEARRSKITLNTDLI